MSRKITNALVALFEKRIESNPLAQMSIDNKKPRQLFVETAKSCLGIKEVSKNKGVEVEEFQKTVHLSAGDAWCMAFMQSCLALVELTLGVTSPLAAGGGCVDGWNTSPKSQRVKYIPLAGAIAVWQHVEDPIHGHTELASSIQNPKSKMPRRRRYDLFNPHYGDMKLLGCLKPF